MVTFRKIQHYLHKLTGIIIELYENYRTEDMSIRAGSESYTKSQAKIFSRKARHGSELFRAESDYNRAVGLSDRTLGYIQTMLAL